MWAVVAPIHTSSMGTGLAPLTRCQRCSAPRSENNQAAHAEVGYSDQEANTKTGIGTNSSE